MATRHYELLVMVDPLKTEEQIKETLGKIEETITKYGGTFERREDWGRRRLAYEISKRRDGYYSMVYFEGPTTSELLEEVNRMLRLEESVMRFLISRAVVGKSLGDPVLFEKYRAAMSARAESHGGRPRRDHRGGDMAPVSDAPAERIEEPEAEA